MIHGKRKNGNDEMQTPDWLYEQLDTRFNFTVDLACTVSNSKNDTCCFDAFSFDWSKHRCFCNPPYSEKKKWIEKAKHGVQNGCPVCVMILPCTMEVLREIKGYHYDILNKRVSFIDPETKKPTKGNATGTVIVYFWGDIKCP